ncbi:MAG: riboflavin kinase, partial [Candidatus Delongbacteria bacterium]|nr:riboflavin kinase [Candidatus Delongbacteria bacterium]
ITNIGLNPTVGNSVMMLESHIFDFNEDIYGKEIRVSFIKRIRDEIRFPSVQELKMAIEEDFIKAKQIEKDYRANR